MDWCSLLRLKLMLLTVFLLVSTNTVRLQGNTIPDHNLHCVNDYLFTVNCSLSIAPSENASDSGSAYWLTFNETYEQQTFRCMLTNTDGEYFCSVKKSDPAPDDYYSETFGELDVFQISLCHSQINGSEPCKLLDKTYRPVTNIKPNAPRCLTVSHNSSKHHFTWDSSYEEHSLFTGLTDDLMYQLHYYERGDKHDVISHKINTESLNYSIADQRFVPDTEYAARVRSSPNQVTYRGQWSDWSSEVHWKMESAVNDLPSNTLLSGLGKVFGLLCMMVPFVLLLCYASFKKWRQSAFIPTPAPYFHTLYSDCQGNFKSWVVTHDTTADMLKAEETLKIDSLIKCVDIREEESQPQFQHQLTEGSMYSNITDPGCDTSLLGIPYAMSTITPPPVSGSSLKSLTLSSQQGSPAEGDSGCWLCSPSSLVRDPPFYCNEYCTLSAFQSSHSRTPREPVDILPDRDYQSGCCH